MWLDIPVHTDIVGNGLAEGELAEQLSQYRYEPGMMRPYINNRNERVVSIVTNRDEAGKPIRSEIPVGEFLNRGIHVNTATLLRDEWARLDGVVTRVSRERLKAWAELSAAVPYGGFDGMANPFIEYETMDDPLEAFVDMEAMTEGRNDAPKFGLQGMPLPITHADYWISKRRLLRSRSGRMPLSTVMAEAATRRVAERIEDTLIGVSTGVVMSPAGANAYTNPSAVYGYLSIPQRLTKSDMTRPTAGGYTPKKTVDELIVARELMVAAGFYGPYVVYYSTDWDQYMDTDYSSTYAGETLRSRLAKIGGITRISRLDRLRSSTYPFRMIMVQMTSDVIQAIDGMRMTMLQWDSLGGLRINFKVMAIQAPLIRFNQDGDTGIVDLVAPA